MEQPVFTTESSQLRRLLLLFQGGGANNARFVDFPGTFCYLQRRGEITWETPFSVLFGTFSHPRLRSCRRFWFSVAILVVGLLAFAS